MATRRSNRRGGVDRVSLLANIIREVDPDMKDAITLEGEKPKKGKSKKEQERIVKEVPLEGPVATERASRLVRLMEDEHYYTLMIGPKSEIRSGKRPPRSITICKEELPTLKELFAAL